MTNKRALPRIFVFAAAIAAGITAVMLSVFFVQYRWLADEITSTSSAEHNAFLAESFERRSRAVMHRVADELVELAPAADSALIRDVLAHSVQDNRSLVGIVYRDADGTEIGYGDLPSVSFEEGAQWLSEYLLLDYAVEYRDVSPASIIGAFSLEELRIESAMFRESIAEEEARTQRESFIKIAGVSLLMLALCAMLVWLVGRNTSRRIQRLKEQAELLRDSDYGEHLPYDGRDDLGDLAAVFNQMRDRLRETTISRDYADSIFSGMNDALIVTSSEGIIERINKATTNLLGYEPAELVGKSIDDVVDSNLSKSLIDAPPSGTPRDAFFESKYRESIPVSYTCSVLEGTEAESGDRIYAAQNITERLRAEKRIRYLARIDALTKIPNRMQFQHLLQRAIARARRDERSLCLFYIDIDHFKEINDTFGHLAGDTTLETVAERISSVVTENTVIGRLGSDEFAVIIADSESSVAAHEHAEAVAKRLLSRLSDPLFVQGHEVFMTASVGIAHYPEDASNVIDLIRNADAALYHAKKAGGNQFASYSTEMNVAAVERLMTKSKLKRAFERDELLVHYQPKYNMETGEVSGAEALVRWDLPERGLVLPSDFIPLAEESDLIVDIGEWVLDKVCQDIRYWQRSGTKPGRVSVNLSLKQLRLANFSSKISSILHSYRLSPTSLELEITESTLMEDPEHTIKILDQLFSLGLHLAIDDFGTGYSSLSALQQFPISTLKIDKSFVRHAATNADDATIVGTIVQMGKNLNMDVVAEGVETEEQLRFLRRLDCTYVQGHLFGDPMNADDFLDVLVAQADGTDRYRALFSA
jgi:diguanylate cyclase (GGDEF)-like protein/PAS domain S-box-containing protein